MKRKIGAFLLAVLLLLALAPAALAAENEQTVRVAVIDTGVSSAVLDAANLAPGKNYILPDQSTEDRHGHGTAISAIIAGSKSAGIEGLCPEAVIVPLVWTSRNEDGSLVQGNAAMTAQAIRDAIDIYGCRIINLSAGAASNDRALWEAADYAEEKGVLIVSSAGNDGSDKAYYPGAYRTVLCVGSCNAEGTARSTFSNTHDRVDLLARGEKLRVASLRGGATTLVSGTSFATAIVTGAAAKIWSADPDITVNEVRTALLSCTRTVDGWQIFDLEAALAWGTENAQPLFSDVAENAYYYDAVLWAAEQGITGGTGDGKFSPDTPCSRAQMAAFLWRASGSPEPKSIECQFTDVDMDSYYGKAVQWAVENGITGGTSVTTFSPDMTCTRGQMATFLCRMAAGKPVSNTSSFSDVSATAYYTEPVQWAYEQKITGGTSATTFSPDANCTRAQMVTFLYRCFVK